MTAKNPTLDYHSLAREYALHREVHPEVLKDLVQTSEITHASHVLDIGCGTGNNLVALEKVVGCSCWGIEPSEQMLAIAGNKTSGSHLRLGKAEQLDYPHAFFDLVFSVDVIHHVGDRLAYFREAYRVLKPGGRICTVTDSDKIIRTRLPLSVYFPETIEIELDRYPSILSLREMMISVGFTTLYESIAEHSDALTNLQKYREKAYPSLHLIDERAFEIGIQKMEHDLKSDPIPVKSRYLLLWGTK